MFAIFLQSDFFWSFKRSPTAVLSFSMVILLIGSAVFAPYIAPYNPFDPASLNLLNGFTKPFHHNEFTGDFFILGSDDQGRDILSTILYGMRVSLFVGFLAVIFALVLGVTLGLIAGTLGGVASILIMRIADIQITFPPILLAMLIFGITRSFIPLHLHDTINIWVLIFAIGLSDWVLFARVVRGTTLVQNKKEFVLAAKMIGRSDFAIMVLHILPNILNSVLVIATISLALAIIAESTLSFLGIGVPPTQPSLGTLIRIGQAYIFSGEWWILFFPSIALLLLALSVNSLGDWLRDALNPRTR